MIKLKKAEEDEKFFKDIRQKAWKERQMHSSYPVHPQPSIQVSLPKKPTFQGKSEVEEIRRMLQDWILAPPVTENIQGLTQFLEELVKTKDLEKVQLILRYFKRYLLNGIVYFNKVFGIRVRISLLNHFERSPIV